MSESAITVATLLSVGFRAFFVLGSLCAVAVMSLWSLAMLGLGPLVAHPNVVFWHAHEMLFGFAAAIIAGFTLTAVAAWTGRPPVRGAPLGWLAATWLAGRMAMLWVGVWPAGLVTTIDMLFPCLLLWLFGREVLAAGNRRNFGVVLVVALLPALNGLFHMGAGGAVGLDRLALLLAVHAVLLLVSVIAGRIVPSFTANWLRRRGDQDSAMPRVVPAVDRAAIIMTAVTGLAVTLAPANPWSGIAALVTAAVHALRLSRWSGMRTRGEPLLFVLHAAYLWFPIGYALTGIAVFGGYLPNVALHALTIGVIGGMILAMVTRVSLGHTGRPLHAARLTVLAYVLLMLAVLARLSGPWLGGLYIETVEASSAAWIVAFALFLWVYWPILSRPRLD